ncbi:EexN family lipoprotein [Simplicispira suum]|uniref:Entry exclusion lipoprotein TrbK n=1 Tax=Simplicispira suum TaxID=2109915 RepID=A0A2S0N581_9BURK|nr:EexN family lipoprotein [Simplicispira suum]AVO43314.1 hypothetical protein C6571_15855 [Simplicispira suum]
MRKTLYFMIAATALLLAGCDRPASIESVDALVANPERLRELRAACKADHAKVGDAQCNAVAEATRKRFLGSGGPKYTPPASPPGGFWQDDDRKPTPAPKGSQ